MSDASLVKRVEILEQTVESLRNLPIRMTAVEGQIVHLRGDLNDGLSALRQAIDDLRLELRAMRYELTQRIDGLDRHMHVLHEDTLERIARLGEGGRSGPAENPAEGR